MSTNEQFDEAIQALRSHIRTLIPESEVEESEESRKGRRFVVFKISRRGSSVSIYLYDDGDLGFTAEDGTWYPLEVWDEKDDKKRTARLFAMLEKHTRMFAGH
jgi:hypothetical protein